MESRPQRPSPQRKREGVVVGAFPTLKLDVDSVRYASLLELDLLYYLEYDRSVTTYSRHPFEMLLIPSGGTPYAYTPDYLVTRAAHQELIMLTLEARIKSTAVQQTIELSTLWAEDHGYHFRVLTEQDIRVGHTLANLKLLWRYSRLAVAPDKIMSCIRYIQRYPEGLPFHTLAAYVAEGDSPLFAAPYIYHLLYRQVLHADLNEPLTPSTCVWFAPTAHAEDRHVS